MVCSEKELRLTAGRLVRDSWWRNFGPVVAFIDRVIWPVGPSTTRAEHVGRTRRIRAPTGRTLRLNERRPWMHRNGRGPMQSSCSQKQCGHYRNGDHCRHKSEYCRMALLHVAASQTCGKQIWKRLGTETRTRILVANRPLQTPAKTVFVVHGISSSRGSRCGRRRRTARCVRDRAAGSETPIDAATSSKGRSM